MPKADATGLAPEKSAEQNPPALSSAPEGFLLCAASPISMVKSRSGGLGHSNAKTARRALQILRLLGPGGIPPKPIAKLRNSPGNNVRISGGKSVTRYTAVVVQLSRVRSGDITHAGAPLRIGWEFSSRDRKSTRLNSSHLGISYAVF